MKWYCLTACFGAFGSIAQAQLAWRFVDNGPDASVASTLDEQPGGFLFVGQASSTALGARTTYYLFDESGEYQTGFPTGGGVNWDDHAPWTYPMADGTGYVTYGRYFASPVEQLGWVRTHLDPAFQVITADTFPDPYPRDMGMRIEEEPNGDLVIAGAAWDPANPLDRELLFQRIPRVGGEIFERTYDSDALTRAVIRTDEGYSVLFNYAVGLGPPGADKLLRFDNEFNYLGGFALPNANGWPFAPNVDSTVFAAGVLDLGNSRSIVAATMFPVFGQIQAILMKFDADGTLVERILPGPMNIRNESPQSLNLVRLTDSTFLWCYQESDLGIESADRFQFAEVDTNLNILRTTTLHVNTTMEAIDLYNMLPMPNGGLALVGLLSPIPITTNWAYVAYLNLRTGMTEPLQGMALQCYPNPGTAFNLQWTGPPLTNAEIDLHDGQGRLVHQGTLSPVGLQVDARSWSSGLYYYRVRYPDGRLIQNGKWMKE